MLFDYAVSRFFVLVKKFSMFFFKLTLVSCFLWCPLIAHFDKNFLFHQHTPPIKTIQNIKPITNIIMTPSNGCTAALDGSKFSSWNQKFFFNNRNSLIKNKLHRLITCCDVVFPGIEAFPFLLTLRLNIGLGVKGTEIKNNIFFLFYCKPNPFLIFNFYFWFSIYLWKGEVNNSFVSDIVY